MREYTIKYCKEGHGLQEAPALDIDQILWSPAVPISANARIGYDEDALYVCLAAVEPNIRAEVTDVLGEPCQDSCLEFFFSPDPEDLRYFNVEFNPNGCIYLGFGSSIRNLIRLLPEEPVISPEISRTEDGWQVAYRIPWTFVRGFFPGFAPRSGGFIRANCYKCGDLTVQPHYLAWNPIELESPTFHCPQFFGKMYFE